MPKIACAVFMVGMVGMMMNKSTVPLLLASNDSNHRSASIFEKDWSKFNDWWRKLKNDRSNPGPTLKYHFVLYDSRMHFCDTNKIFSGSLTLLQLICAHDESPKVGGSCSNWVTLLGLGWVTLWENNGWGLQLEEEESLNLTNRQNKTKQNKTTTKNKHCWRLVGSHCARTMPGWGTDLLLLPKKAKLDKQTNKTKQQQKTSKQTMPGWATGLLLEEEERPKNSEPKKVPLDKQTN